MFYFLLFLSFDCTQRTSRYCGVGAKVANVFDSIQTSLPRLQVNPELRV